VSGTSVHRPSQALPWLSVVGRDLACCLCGWKVWSVSLTEKMRSWEVVRCVMCVAVADMFKQQGSYAGEGDGIWLLST